jgi:hypothetical protein
LTRVISQKEEGKNNLGKKVFQKIKIFPGSSSHSFFIRNRKLS